MNPGTSVVDWYIANGDDGFAGGLCVAEAREKNTTKAAPTIGTSTAKRATIRKPLLLRKYLIGRAVPTVKITLKNVVAKITRLLISAHIPQFNRKKIEL
jgi:hypothetical protein